MKIKGKALPDKEWKFGRPRWPEVADESNNNFTRSQGRETKFGNKVRKKTRELGDFVLRKAEEAEVAAKGVKVMGKEI